MSQSARILVLLVLSVASYFSIYGYYRFIREDGVLDYIGMPNESGIGESFSGKSFVTEFHSHTGVPIAGFVNKVYWPAASLDGLFSGRHIKFNDHEAQPVQF